MVVENTSGIKVARFFTRAILFDCLWLGIPLALYLIARISGWFGILQGFICGFLCPLSFLLLAAFYISRAFVHLRKDGPVALTDVLLIIICCAGFYSSAGFQHNPFLDGFEGRLKHDYGTRLPEIQTWAIVTLKAAKHETYLVDQRNWPICLKIPNFPKPRVIISNEENMIGRESISVAWGSGMVGGWGLIVGNPTLSLKYDEWSPGVFYFRGK